ncbi:hypothetical protein LSTR_LSTR007287 [Laodelphax striatellus]|uniref:Dynein axonemal assembly factor 1 homolog n=1 Tax=Laodelphax striatellus TaxID=195883 RepID=A0A482XDE8_LAOST|nr:hypothetical protein LSTR_LSTR007287 [Laodelphax striatellus]
MSESESENEFEEEEDEEENEGDKEQKTEVENSNFPPIVKKLSPYEFEGKHDQKIILTKDVAMDSLKRPGFSPDGLGIAYTELDLKSKNLVNIEVATSFKYVMYLNVSFNKLTNKSLSCLRLMPQLLMVRADSNLLTSTDLPHIAFLQILTLNNNNLTKISKISQPNLGVLLLNDNKIERVENLDTDILKNLRRLSLKRNNITTLQGVCLQSLRYLYLQQNKIESLKGIDRLQNLIVLNVADNQIAKLDGFSPNMKMLRELYLHNNKIASISEISKLYKLTALRLLTTGNNPFSKTDENRQEILMRLLRIDELNARKVSPSERKEAYELRLEREYEEGSEKSEELDEEEEEEEDDD